MRLTEMCLPVAKHTLLTILLIVPQWGCFSERSYPLATQERIPVTGSWEAPNTRDWLQGTHEQLEHLLPHPAKPALLTESLTDPEGRATDVFAHFGIRPDGLRTLLGNCMGLLHTAHQAATRNYIYNPPPPWPGFEQVWIPVSDDIELSARLGLAKNGDTITQADCIVILPGLFGDNGVLRSRDLAEGLLTLGFHVLSVELRGCGQTLARYPKLTTSWGVFETGDLLAVSRWLQDKPYVDRCGLVGFCWGANIALLSAWADGRGDTHISIDDSLRPFLPAADPSLRHFTAGVIAFSPVVRFEELCDLLEKPHGSLQDPILSGIQDVVRSRMRLQEYRPASGSLRRLIDLETSGYDLGVPNLVDLGLRYLRLLPYRGLPAGDKLEDARIPVLIVHAANDPLIPAQDVADLIATIQNPQVAAIILPGGGHVGFSAYANAYHTSLIAAFFNHDQVTESK